MSHASMYLYSDPTCVKVGVGDLQGYMYTLILLLILILIKLIFLICQVPKHSSVHHSTRGLLVLFQHPAGVVLWQFLSCHVVTYH